MWQLFIQSFWKVKYLSTNTFHSKQPSVEDSVHPSPGVYTCMFHSFCCRKRPSPPTLMDKIKSNLLNCLWPTLPRPHLSVNQWACSKRPAGKAHVVEQRGQKRLQWSACRYSNVLTSYQQGRSWKLSLNEIQQGKRFNMSNHRVSALTQDIHWIHVWATCEH